MSKWIVATALAMCLAGYVFAYATGRADQPIHSDGFSYYVYLPSWFIFHDPSLSAVARDCCGGVFPAFTAIIRWPATRRWVNAHPIGVAVMQAPFFLLAHGLTRWSNLSPDGFTLYYQHAAGVSGLAWTIAGLWMLRRLLRRHFSDGVTAATLVAILLGTNLYHYATFDSTYSHAYSFFLIATFLDLTEQWHARPSRRGSILLGLVAGLIVLTRHTNAAVLLIFPLYGIVDRASARAARSALLARRRELAIIVATMAIVVAPQLAIYYQATGRLVVSSYGALGFDFASPHVLEVLFGVRKGLFFWSPLLMLGIAGFLMRHAAVRPFEIPALLVFAIHTLVVSSWWDWQFGASYGHRAFVDLLPLFALGVAACFEWSARSRVRLSAVSAIAISCIALSVFQMLQYWNGVLPMSDTTWDQYRSVFLRIR